VVLTRYYPGGFTVSNIQMPGPVFLCYRMSLLWKAPSSVEDLSPSDLPLLSLIKPPPGEWRGRPKLSHFLAPFYDILY
jgi:hypothetical protein